MNPAENVYGTININPEYNNTITLQDFINFDVGINLEVGTYLNQYTFYGNSNLTLNGSL